jgi:thiol-disulfide isomerase/thioredoxin
MKIKISVFILLVSIQLGFSQKIIENPQYGSRSLPGEITKMEILDDATVLHFHLKLRPGVKIAIPEKSCIIANGSDKKLFITKAEGIEMHEWYTMDSTGVIDYKLYFPPLNKQVGKIDFVESNKGGNWYVYGLVIDEAKYGSILPKTLKGNWLKTDGSNSWVYGFYNDRAIVNKQIWTYKAVKNKKTKFEITLENEHETKVIYAKLNTDNTVDFGVTKKQFTTCSLKRTENKNFKLEDDEPYEASNIFKMDSTTYSGVLRNFSHRNKQKTGTISVNNIFTGNQDSYLVNIKSDGRFSVKFPLYYPQEIYVRLPGYYGGVFVEPGKETWQLINSGKRNDVFFAGDLAVLNSGLASLESIINREAYYKIQKNVKEFSLQAYKDAFVKIHNNETDKYDSIAKTRFISEKLNQVMRLKLDYGFYEQLLAYDTYNRDTRDRKIDSTYILFLTPEIRNNKLGVLAESYYGFINRLRFSKPFNANKSLRVTHPQGIELAELLKTKAVTITPEEQELINAQLKFNEDNAATLQKQKDFGIKNKALLDSFNAKFGELYTKLSKEERKEIFTSEGLNVDAIMDYAKPLDITFTDEEIAMQKAKKNVLTKEEKEAFKAFNTPERNTKNQAFSKHYTAEIQEYTQQELQRQKLENTIALFDEQDTWLSDIFIMQQIAAPILEQLSPLSNQELETVSNQLNTPFAKEFLAYENQRGLAKIEANKSATGYVVNETPDTEADKVFNAIIEKYKDKVIFIDFWATWCGPCRSGMKKMKPMKEELKDEDVVFVFITNQTSPEKTYKAMIPEIKGEHYRLSDDEWNYLKIKFNITGIPHYTLVDKQGIVVKEKIKFWSSEAGFVKMIKDYL